MVINISLTKFGDKHSKTYVSEFLSPAKLVNRQVSYMETVTILAEKNMALAANVVVVLGTFQ